MDNHHRGEYEEIEGFPGDIDALEFEGWDVPVATELKMTNKTESTNNDFQVSDHSSDCAEVDADTMTCPHCKATLKVRGIPSPGYQVTFPCNHCNKKVGMRSPNELMWRI